MFSVDVQELNRIGLFKTFAGYELQSNLGKRNIKKFDHYSKLKPTLIPMRQI